MKSFNKSIAALLVLITVLMLLPVQAFAAGSIDLDRDESLTVSYQDGSVPLLGANFSIYLIATVDEHGELTTTESFQDFDVKIRGKNDEAWNALTTTLVGYILRDGIPSTDTGVTNAEGALTFPTGTAKLTAGLYLVLGSRHTQNGYIYDAQPFLVMLPTLNKEANDWNYAVTVRPKFDKQEVPVDETITRKVLKIWQDTGHENSRPKEVIVQLLCDGVVYDTVTLNKDNNWRYKWEELDASSTWTVVEKKLDNYTVNVTLDGVTFVVTNTYKNPSPTTPTSTTPDHRLPQTGQLWWPVPVLAAVGMLFVIVGLVRRKYENE